MIQINQTDAQGFYAVFPQIVALGPQAQACLAISPDVSLVLGVTPQGQLVVTPTKTLCVVLPSPFIDAVEVSTDAPAQAEGTSEETKPETVPDSVPAAPVTTDAQ